MMSHRHWMPALAVVATFALASCQTMKDAVNAIPMPHLKLPKMPKLPKLPKLSSVTKIIPGMGSDDSVGADDPVVSFDARASLGYGHTLRVEVHEGTRSPIRRFRDLVFIDRDGVAKIGDFGSAKLGGHSIAEARRMIETVLRSRGAVSAAVNVHIVSVENQPVVCVDGDVAVPSCLPVWEGITVAEAIRFCGGRRQGSSAQAVYVLHEGVRRFFSTAASADRDFELSPGDIIVASPHL
jgi:hypothetical protein